MPHSFEEKLDRAEQHLNALRLKIERWQEDKPYVVTDELDPDTGENILCIEPIGIFPEVLQL